MNESFVNPAIPMSRLELKLIRTHINHRVTTPPYLKKIIFLSMHILPWMIQNIMLDFIYIDSDELRRMRSKRKFQNEKFLSKVRFEPTTL